MSYILEEGGSASAMEAYISGNLSIAERYPNWSELQRFLRNIEGVVLPAKSTHLKFEDLTAVIHELQTHFGRWQDGECQEQMRELHKMDQECPGHVNLRDFYAANLYKGKWQFSETADYLRALGALEESQPDSPRVILANYVQGPNNCVSSSRYYSQCCLNPCSSHLAKLEQAVGGPEVSPEVLQSTIAMVLPRPQASPTQLWDRLRKIAPEGKVALHGSSFAEWLHRAYPRDCPAPVLHAPKQERPREYTARTGDPTDVPEAEMRSFVEESPGHVGQCDLKWGVSADNSWDKLESETRYTGRRLLNVLPTTETFFTFFTWPWASFAALFSTVLLFALYPRRGKEPVCDLLVTSY